MIKNMIKSSFKNLKKYEWFLLVVMVIIGIYYTLTDKTHPNWYLIINLFSSICGVCCIFLCAHASWPNWLFAIVNTALYIAILFYNKVYGTLGLELFYYMPTNIIGILAWKKHKDTLETDKCLTKTMNKSQRICMFLITLFSSMIYYVILRKIGGATAFLDALSVAIGVIATYLEIKRYADQYLLWIVVDIITVIQWIILSDLIMITKRSIYLIMAIIGFINWIKLKKERNEENI